MKSYTVSIHGCDDSTVFDITLTAEELEVVEKISELSRSTSTYVCMPTLVIESSE